MERLTVVRSSGITVFIGIVAVSLLALSASTSWAEKEHHGPCASDVEKYCRDVQPGEGRIAKCLKEHEKDLSPACRERGAEMKQKMGGFRAACEGDVQKLCKDIQPGEGRVIKCLKDHEKELSPDCNAAMEKGRGMQRERVK